MARDTNIPVWDLRNTFVSAITSLEIQIGSPVVGKIVSRTAGSAGCET